jgi:hypothetical protein
MYCLSGVLGASTLLTSSYERSAISKLETYIAVDCTRRYAVMSDQAAKQSGG